MNAQIRQDGILSKTVTFGVLGLVSKKTQIQKLSILFILFILYIHVTPPLSSCTMGSPIRAGVNKQKRFPKSLNAASHQISRQSYLLFL